MQITSKAYAKLNLSLDIVSRMDNGYHNMKMVMQTIDLFDEISIKCTAGEGVFVQSNVPFLPNDKRNIATKAAIAFYEKTGISGYKTNISIKKNIPICAGMGGGSADAACVLRVLNQMFKVNLTIDTLRELGLSIGSDVPFCIDGGTKLAQGQGEILTTLPPLPAAHFVICKPNFSCSTPKLFSLVKCQQIKMRPDTAGLIKALEKSDLRAVARRMYNVFEMFLPSGIDTIEEIKNTMIDHGAIGAIMTGSGPTVFGVFDNRQSATYAFMDLKYNYRECYLAKNIGQY